MSPDPLDEAIETSFRRIEAILDRLVCGVVLTVRTSFDELTEKARQAEMLSRVPRTHACEAEPRGPPRRH